MNTNRLIKILIALLLMAIAGGAAYFGVKYFTKEKIQPVLEKYEATNDPAELREALLRNCTNSVAMLDFAEWSKSRKQQFIQITDGFSDLAQKKTFGKCLADSLVSVDKGDDFIHNFSDANSEVLNIIRADIVRGENAKK